MLLLLPLGDPSLRLRDPSAFINVSYVSNRIVAPRRIWKL